MPQPPGFAAPRHPRHPRHAWHTDARGGGARPDDGAGAGVWPGVRPVRGHRPVFRSDVAGRAFRGIRGRLEAGRARPFCSALRWPCSRSVPPGSPSGRVAGPPTLEDAHQHPFRSIPAW